MRLMPSESPLSVALISIVAYAALVASVGCHDGPPPAAAVAAPEVVAPANPIADAPPVDRTMAGEVAEVLPAGSYTYFRTADGRWAVVLGAGPAVGDRVLARVFAEKNDFRSRRLDRTFAALRFVSLIGG